MKNDGRLFGKDHERGIVSYRPIGSVSWLFLLTDIATTLEALESVDDFSSVDLSGNDSDGTLKPFMNKV